VIKDEFLENLRKEREKLSPGERRKKIIMAGGKKNVTPSGLVST
jgi:hypothetical protein